MIDPAEAKKQLLVRCEVMMMRARGKKSLLLAAQKRRHKMMKKSSTDWHTHLGLVDDADFGDWNIRQEEICANQMKG